MCAWPLPKKTHPKLPSPWKGDGPNGIIFHQPRFPWNKGDLHYNHHHLGWQLSWGRYNFDQVPSLFGFDVKKRYVPLSKLLIVGMVIPPFNKESLCWVYKPLLLGWWPSSFIHSSMFGLFQEGLPKRITPWCITGNVRILKTICTSWRNQKYHNDELIREFTTTSHSMSPVETS